MAPTEKAAQIEQFRATALKLESKWGGNAVIGFFRDRTPIPDKVREVMHANSQALAGLTMKAPC
jgi:hypothetical protein